MATVVNDRDVLIMGAVPRFTAASDRGLLIAADSPVFNVAADGTPTPAEIKFSAVRLNLSGAASFAASDGAVLVVSGDVATLTYANMPANSSTVTVTASDAGATYQRSVTVSKVFASGSRFTWVKYADDATGSGISDDPTGKEYIGFAYNKTTQTESSTPTDYAWSLIKGGDGVPGAPGADGTTYYTWIKYADQPDGTGLYDAPTANTLYIGIAVNRTTATESTNKADYVWSRFKGEKGDQGVPGTGQRGPGWFYVVGSSWSDIAAHAATPGDTQVDDTVTISNGTVTYTKRWDGSVWYVPGAYMDGSLFVEKSITAAKINANGLELRDTQGNLILGAGTALRAGFEAPNTKNSDFQNGTLTIGGDNLADNSSFERTVGDFALGYNVYNNNVGAEPTTYSGSTGRTGSGRAQVVSWTGSHNWQKGITGTMCRGGWTPGKTYIISVWAKTTNLSSAGGMTIEWNSAPSTAVALQNPNLSATWQRYAWKITWGASVEVNGNAYISVHLGSGGGNVHFDDLMVVEGEVLPAYAPSSAEAAKFADAAKAEVDSLGAGSCNLIPRNSLPNDASTYYCTDYGQNLGFQGATHAGSGHAFNVYSLNESGNVFVHVPGTPSNGSTVDLLRSDTFPIIPGQRYEFGVNLSTHRCVSVVKAFWYDVNGSYIGEATGTAIDNAWQASQAQTIAGIRSIVIENAPPAARSVRLGVRQVHDGRDNPYTFASQWYFGEARPAQTKPSPWSESSGGVGDKISKTAASILKAPITVQTGGGVSVGDLTWDAQGYRTGGKGVGITPYGIIGHNGVKYTFYVNAANGSAYFAGDLEAAGGTLGALRIADGGSIATGAYSAAAGYNWPANGAGGGYFLNQTGILAGNANDPGRGYILINFDTGRLAMPGFDYSGRQLTLDQPIIVNPKQQTSFSATMAGVTQNGLANTSTYRTYSFQPTLSNGVGPYSYFYVFSPEAGDIKLTSSPTPSDGWAVVSARGSNQQALGYLTVTITDANGSKATVTCRISLGFGAY